MLRETGITILVILFLVWPSAINSLLIRAGFTTADVAGFHWEKALQESAKSTSAAQQTIDTVRQSIDSAIAQIRTLSGNLTDPRLKQGLQQIEQQLDGSLETAHSASKDLNASARYQINVLQTVAPALQTAALDTQGESGPWMVVIGADKDHDSAQDEVKRAVRQGYTSVAIYKRGNFFRTAIRFDSKSDAQDALEKIQDKIRGSAYLVNLNSWCPGNNFENGIRQCS